MEFVVFVHWGIVIDDGNNESSSNSSRRGSDGGSECNRNVSCHDERIVS